MKLIVSAGRNFSAELLQWELEGCIGRRLSRYFLWKCEPIPRINKKLHSVHIYITLNENNTTKIKPKLPSNSKHSTSSDAGENNNICITSTKFHIKEKNRIHYCAYFSVCMSNQDQSNETLLRAEELIHASVYNSSRDLTKSNPRTHWQWLFQRISLLLINFCCTIFSKAKLSSPLLTFVEIL